MTRSVAIVGAYESPRRAFDGLHPFAVQVECIQGALQDAGLTLSDVDGFCTAAGVPGEGGMTLDLMEVIEYLAIRPTFFDSTDIGGCSFMTHAMRAADAIRVGRAKVVVVSYAAGVRSWPIPGYWDELGFPYGPGAFELAYSPTTVAQYGLLATRHMAVYGTTPEQLAHVAVTCRDNAASNPHAKYRAPLTIDDVLGSPMIADPLHRLDCCVLTESGGAIVLTGADRARDCARKPVWLAGYGECAGELWMSQRFRSDLSPGVTSGRLAFEMAGVKPADVDVAQLYDAFTITPLIALEDLGICKAGEAGAYVASGAVGAGGELPINTDGGGLSSNHPGRRGMFVMIEAARQLRGEGPGVQVTAPEVSLAHGIGSIYASAATMILTV